MGRCFACRRGGAILAPGDWLCAGARARKCCVNELKTEIERRWRELFARLAGGEDASPGMRLRTEGMMEAAVVVGSASRDALQTRMAEVYSEVFDRALSDDFGADWREFFPFPQIPAMGRRAPVYPSTREPV